MKGAFGGGFAIIGIPLMALVMDPITAGSVLAPVFVAMDLFALRYWKPRTWSRPDLAWLVPGLLAGVAAGYVVLRQVDRHFIEVLMAVTTLLFAWLWWRGGAGGDGAPALERQGVAGGGASGITTMVAHSGGPPLAMYLLPLGLSRKSMAAPPACSSPWATCSRRGRGWRWPTCRAATGAWWR
ncbi:sulfite exporter TauE/SafE family protein [Achromobacter insuavis]